MVVRRNRSAAAAPRGSSAGRLVGSHHHHHHRTSSRAAAHHHKAEPPPPSPSGDPPTTTHDDDDDDGGDGPCCDFYDRPTLLSRHVLRQRYDLALARLRSHPEEARVWVRRARSVVRRRRQEKGNSNRRVRRGNKQRSPMATVYNPHAGESPPQPGQFSEEETTGSSSSSAVVDVVFQCLPLHLACHNLGLYHEPNNSSSGDSALLLPLRQQLQTLIARLVEAHPAGARCADRPYRQYPLHLCLRHGARLGLIKVLLTNGAAATMAVPDGDGATPAEWNALCTFSGSKRDAVAQLLQRGCTFWTEVRRNVAARRRRQQQEAATQQQQQSAKKNAAAEDDDSAVWSELQAALRGDEAENVGYDCCHDGGDGRGRTPLAWSQLEARCDRLEALLVASMRRERQLLRRRQTSSSRPPLHEPRGPWTAENDEDDDDETNNNNNSTAGAVCSDDDHATATASTDSSPPLSAGADLERDRLLRRVDRLEAVNRRHRGRIADLHHEVQILTWSSGGGGGGGGVAATTTPEQNDEYYEKQLQGYSNHWNDCTSSIFNYNNGCGGGAASAATTINNNNSIPMDTSGVSSLSLSGVSVNWDAPPPQPMMQFPQQQQQPPQKQQPRPSGMWGDHSRSRGGTPVRQPGNNNQASPPRPSPSLLSSSPPGAARGRMMALIQEGRTPPESPQRRRRPGNGGDDLLRGIASPGKYPRKEKGGNSNNSGTKEISYFFTDDDDDDDDAEMDTAAAAVQNKATRGDARGFVPIPEFDFYNDDDEYYDNDFMNLNSFDVVQVDDDYDEEDLDSILAEVQEKKGSRLSSKIVHAWNRIEVGDVQDEFEPETQQEEEADDDSSSRALSRISEREEVEDSSTSHHQYYEEQDITVDRESYERSFSSTPKRTNTGSIPLSHAHDIIVTPIFDDAPPFRYERALI